MRLRQSAALKRRGDVPVAYDDLDGTPVFDEEEVRRVSFDLDGVMYEMDLSQGHAAKFVESLQPFIDAARVRKSSRGVRKPNRREKETGDDRMEQLAASEFYREHGHINVPSTLVVEGWKVGRWMSELRVKYRRGALPVGVVERAEELGVDWNPRKDRTVEHLDRLERSEFYREHGHINVPQSAVLDGWKAGQWLRRLRGKYRRGELSAGVVARAESLRIIWTHMVHVSDVEGLGWLEQSEFYREHGHINVPSTLVIDGWNGGQWLHHLRRKYRRDALPTGVVERAEELGIDWIKSR